MRNIIIWTPCLIEENGQNQVTRYVVKKWEDQVTLVVFKSGLIGFLSVLSSYLKITWLFIKISTPITLYCVVSRSTFGSLRDLVPLSFSLMKARVVAHVHGSDLPKLLRQHPTRRIFMFLYKRVHVVVPSSYVRDELVNLGLRNVTVCENFCDFEPVRSEENLKAENIDLKLIWNSNIISSKGIKEVLVATKQLLSEGYNIQLTVLGKPISDIEMTEYEMHQFISEYTHLNNVNIIGQTRPEDAIRFLQKSDAVILPSTYVSECQPLSIIQAMVAGKRLILADNAPLRATTGSYPAIFCHRSITDVKLAIKATIALHVGASHGPTSWDIAAANERFSKTIFDRKLAEILE